MKTNKQTATQNQNTNMKTNGLQNRSEQVGGQSRPQIDLQMRRQNRSLDLESLLALLRSQAPRFFELAEVVGKWVWVEFKDKPPAEITTCLSQYGFHWNNRRQVWQHPCGSVSEGTDRDPRRKYQSYFPADHKTA